MSNISPLSLLNSTLSWDQRHNGPRDIGTAGIVAITVFSVLAICLCAGAIYLLAKNKNISDILEDVADDGTCTPCDGRNVMDDSPVEFGLSSDEENSVSRRDSLMSGECN